MVACTCLSVPNSYGAVKDIEGEMNFIKLEPIEYVLEQTMTPKTKYRSEINQLWYTYFKAEENYEHKPLFVFLNGGPGCGTSMNLFAMNTAPYTLDRAMVKSNHSSDINKLFAENDNRWTSMGNLLYIDAPNTGFSYMIYDQNEENKRHRNKWIKDNEAFRPSPFVFGDNYNVLIDADQVLRCLFKFLAQHEDIKYNEVILVGESYSGVRVTTMLNLLLRYKQFSNGSQVYHDAGFAKVIEKHFEKFPGRKGSGPVGIEDITKQFKRQILIQPQIVDKYQAEDEFYAFLAPNSRMDKLIGVNEIGYTWKEYVRNIDEINKKKWPWQEKEKPSALSYLTLIDRDPYHCKKPASWSTDNEYFAMQALKNVKALEQIACLKPGTIKKIKGFNRQNRTNALRFALHKGFAMISSDLFKRISVDFPDDIRPYLEMVPSLDINGIHMDNPIGSLELELGELNPFDAYLVGTNPYIYVSFMLNGGGETIPGIALSYFVDRFDIGPGISDRYGKMFIENLTRIDTFMTYAANDIIVYSPALASQFDKGRFKHLISNLVYTTPVNTSGPSKMTFHYKKGGIQELGDLPETRSVDWFYYGKSGHSVSSTEPKKFRDDVRDWLSGKYK